MVLTFLTELKDFVEKKQIYFVERKELGKTAIALGLTKEHSTAVLLELTPAHYVSGPIADHDPKLAGFIWIFGPQVNGRDLYIKLKIVSGPDKRFVRCISFHEAERSMKYPLRLDSRREKKR